MTGNPLAAAVQRERDEQVAAAEERAWHDGWAAAWRRCAEVIAGAIETQGWADEGPYARHAAALAREIGARAVRPAGRVRRGSRDGGPAAFVGEVTDAQTPQDPHSGAAYMESPQPTPEDRPTEPTARS